MTRLTDRRDETVLDGRSTLAPVERVVMLLEATMPAAMDVVVVVVVVATEEELIESKMLLSLLMVAVALLSESDRP